jgi:hypothetical protein
MFVRLVGVVMSHMNSSKRTPLNERTSPSAAIQSPRRPRMTAERKSSGRKCASSSRFEVPQVPWGLALLSRHQVTVRASHVLVVLDANMRLFSAHTPLDPLVSWTGIARVFLLDSAGAGQSFVDRRDLVSKHVGSSLSRCLLGAPAAPASWSAQPSSNPDRKSVLSAQRYP